MQHGQDVAQGYEKNGEKSRIYILYATAKEVPPHMAGHQAPFVSPSTKCMWWVEIPPTFFLILAAVVRRLVSVLTHVLRTTLLSIFLQAGPEECGGSDSSHKKANVFFSPCYYLLHV